jgi:aryl-alcohol dehydrogenase-like predicted oxidoreductase
VEASLRRLATDHIDVYQLHGPRVVGPDLFGQLEDLVLSGKVLRFGVGAETVADAAAWAPVDGVGVVQVPFGVLDPEAADDVFPLAERHDVEIWARGVLGGGLLAAAIGRPAAMAGHPKQPLVARLQDVASRHGIGLDELAIGFARSFPRISTVLLGISTTDHLRRNLDLVTADPLDSSIVDEVKSVLPTTGTADD